ncbi:MAG TPA: 16S rRNA (uracil(1498)-N(3))-methyltransferase [Micromonosporaceae bacterium]|nr:16S rRNA (uracil(1498)-N(3))-methyltransferase [Micromonosporaceae bacterium]
MSAPLFLVDALPEGNECTLSGPEGHHAATVARLRVGESVLVGDGLGTLAEGVVTEVGRGVVQLRLGRRWHEQEPSPRLVVVQALAKGDRGELAVQAMTEVGVDEIVPWAATRSVVRWREGRGERSHQRWVATAREAAKQARRARLPVVAALATTDAVAQRIRTASAALVLHEEAGEPLSRVAPPPTGDVVLVVGPEGGITPEELATFTAAGATPVRLGPTVLRTSTAGVAALAALSVRLGRW